MGKGRRRGSSTRKYKSKQTILPIVNRKPAEKTDKGANKDITMLGRLTQRLMDGVNGKGRPLTDEDISKTKVRIANLEHTLRINHETQ